MELGPVDGIVLADVDIIRVFGNVQIGTVGDIGKSLVLGGSHLDRLAVFAGFLPGLLGPLARHDIGRFPVLHQIHGDSRELGPGPALQEQYLVVIGDLHQFTKISLRLLDDTVKDLAAVAHFHNGHAASAVIQHFIRRFL